MFRKVYAQIGFADTQADVSDEEASDKLTREISPPSTPVVETAPARFSLTNLLSINLNKIQSQPKAQQPAIPSPKTQALNNQQRNSPSPSPPVQSPSPSVQSPPLPAKDSPSLPTHSSSPSFPVQSSSSPAQSSTNFPNQNSPTFFTNSPITPHQSNPLSPPLTHSVTPPPPSISPRKPSANPLIRATSLSSSPRAQYTSTGTSPANSSPPFPLPPPPASTIPRNFSNPQMFDQPQPVAPGAQMRPSRSTSNLQDTSRSSPIPLIPTPPLSNSPVVPVLRTDSPLERPIPPTAAPTLQALSDPTSFFTSAPPSFPFNPSLSSMKRVSSVPQMAPTPSPTFPPTTATRRNSNTPSPLAQPWPTPEKTTPLPSLPTSPNQLLIDMDDEEESLISRTSQAPIPLRPRTSSQPPPLAHTQLPTRSSPLTTHPSPLTSHPSPLSFHSSPLTSHPSPLPSHPSPLTSHPSPLVPHPSSQPQPSTQISSPSIQPISTTSDLPTPPPTQPPSENLTSPSPSPSPSLQPLSPQELSTKPNPEIMSPEMSNLGTPNKLRPGLRESFQSDQGGTATPDPPEEIIKSGWLTRQDKAKENWVWLYFSLTPTSLLYFEGENESRKGKITLEGYEVIIVDPEEIHKQFCFMLTHPNKRVFYMNCKTRDEMLAWIIAVQEVLDKLNPTGVPVKETLIPIADTDPKYELVYAMLHAIRFSVSKMAALPYLDIGLEELNANTSFSTDKQGSAGVPSSNYPYSFVDYAPKAFRKIREIFGFDCADYLLSLTSQYTLSELPTPGKSGSFFYYSNDRKFMLKTISATEFDNFLQMLPNYFLHILQNPNTLLTRLFGLHKISTENSRSIVFVVMENIFLDYEMEETYDLKGSTIGRKSDGTSSILKDLDWKRRILLDSQRGNSLLFQIELDCKFLEKNNIMDYSFLLGLRFINHNDEERNKRPYASIFQREKGGYQATTEEGGLYDIVYYFGIIDIFTTYNIKKQLEHTYKSTIYETKDAISVVDAVKYAQRFRKFIASTCGWLPQK